MAAVAWAAAPRGPRAAPAPPGQRGERVEMRARERKENEEPAEPDNRTEEEKLFDKQVTNLCKRYPVASEDDVKKALTETKGVRRVSCG